ncbi:MAG: hypothetical protein KDC48_17360 [Planctomycetes bacterium]|nr:hypothetical protein [Planctomycetota bacterium]
MLAGLALLDLAFGWLCESQSHLPMDDRSAIARYFDYGRSLEGKLDQLVDDRDGKVQGLADAGWIRPAADDQPKVPGPGQNLLISVYGMSFAHHIAHAMARQDPRLAIRASGGPGASLSQCVALFEADRGQHQARVEVLGVLASSLVGTVTMSHMTWNFEVPAACLYPRFTLDDGRLVRHEPPANDLAQLRALTAGAAGRQRLRDALQQHDAFFEPLVFDAFLDRSVLVKMLRRAYGQSHEAALMARLHDSGGFTDALQLPELARALTARFLAETRADGAVPVLLLIDDLGYDDHLDRLMAPLTADPELLTFSTYDLADPNDPGNFVADGHFTAAVDERLAEALRTRIDKLLGRN